MTYRVMVIGGRDYIKLFQDEGGFEVVDSNPDLICFTGGADVHPSVYGHKQNHYTMYTSMTRDTHENELFDTYKDIPKIGICRGAQLLCALSGGSLYQHVNHHTHGHIATTDTGIDMYVTSTHHQMMNPLGVDHKVLMAAEPIATEYWIERDKVSKPPIDYEVVYFPNTKSLCHQPHPERMEPTSPYRLWFFETVNQLLRGEL